MRLSPPAGKVQFGDLRRLTPISGAFGFDRGVPIDRYYIECFLARNAETIHGRVLEIGDNVYTKRFGGSRVTKSDVLHVREGSPRTTLIGDLTEAPHIPSETFDCVLLTQTLQLIYDIRSAVQTIYRVLRPGGSVLATFPGVSQIDRGEWGGSWCWGFTAISARRLFEEVFPSPTVSVETYGNVLVAVAFLHGLSVDELHQDELDFQDPQYQFLVSVRAAKPQSE